MTQHSIYALCEPGSLTVRYVGKTKAPLSYRLGAHVSRAKRIGSDDGKVAGWIGTLAEQPEIILLAECPADLVYQVEAEWIAVFSRNGYDLLNSNARRMAARQERADRPQFANAEEWFDYECAQLARKRGITVDEARELWRVALLEARADARLTVPA